jgi:hypothetical protein
MTKIYFEYEQHTWVTDPGDPPEVEWGSRESTDGDYTITSAHLSTGARDCFESTEDVAEGDTIYVVYVVYGDGDTFGSSGGYSEILAVTKDRDLARQAELWVHKPTTVWSEHKHDWSDAKVSDCPGWPDELGKHPYPSWTGYFNWVSKVQLDEFVVKP